MLRDAGLALRTLIRRPGYATVVVGVMAIGIGATTTVLTVADRVLLRPLPHAEAGRLVVLGSTFPDREWRQDAPGLQALAGFSLANFLDWQERARSFELAAGVERRTILLPDRGDGPELVPTTGVTPDFFDIFSIRPVVGRLFHRDEYREGAAPVALLSHDAWTTRFGRDPAVVGAHQASVAGGLEIVGVLPEGFRVPEAMAATVDDFWIPIALDSERYADRGMRSLFGLALLRPGVTLESARAEMDGLARALAEEHPEGNVYPDGRHLGAGVNTLQSHTVAATGRPIALFMAAALLLLLIAGLNTANLILSRGLARVDELGVRRALGASRGTLARLLLTESLVLSAAGGAAGIALAWAGVKLFQALGPPGVPRMDEVALDARIMIMAAALTLGCGVATGVMPALRLSRRSLSAGLRKDGSGLFADRGGSWTIGAQIALSLTLVVAAGLLLESFIRVRTFDAGFAPEGALTFQQGLKRPGTADVPTYMLWDEVLTTVSSVPGYERVAAASNLPYQSPNWGPWVLLPGEDPTNHRTGVAGYVITWDYLATIGVPILEGRPFDPGDGPDGRRVAIVNRAFVDMHMGGGTAVGTTIRFREDDGFQELTVVGVAGNTVQTRPEEGVRAAVYVPYTQSDWPSMWVFARASGDPTAGMPQIRQDMATVNPWIPPARVASMEERMARARTSPRFYAALALAFGLVSVLLSAGGLYGTLSFHVGRRIKEIGIRIALGADRPSVVGLVLRKGLGLTAVGIAVGLVAAWLGSRALSAFLFGVSPKSPLTFGLAALALVLVAVAASVAPALRATKVDPISSLQA